MIVWSFAPVCEAHCFGGEEVSEDIFNRNIMESCWCNRVLTEFSGGKSDVRPARDEGIDEFTNGSSI